MTAGGPALFAQSSQDTAVRLSASVQTSPAQVTLTWPALSGATDHTVYRKLPADTSWGTGTSLGAGATNYVDTTVTPGTVYEYRIAKTGGTAANGYIAVGVEGPLTENRGKLVLLVDNRFTVSLSNEVATLQQDLIGDGWQVIRYDVATNTSVASIKGLITAEYLLDPVNVKSVFLLGHVAVPYSGQIAPDGHGDHIGAWPADMFYGEMNGAWTDTTINNTSASRQANWNVPGDGKYDQSNAPNDIELQVGRVDLNNMPLFALPEQELLRQYLNRNHNWRHKLMTAQPRGLIDDNFGYFGGEAFAASGWRAFSGFFGANNVTSLDWFGTLTNQNETFVWAYGCGGGSYTSASGVGNTAQFTSNATYAVFTCLFGSYHGDWDSQNNFMRAALANSGYGLTCAWSGRPQWHFLHMGVGEPIGYSTRLTQNNTGLYISSYNRSIHIGLMGDPTLRMHVVEPPSWPVAVTNGTGGAVLSWRRPAESVLGFHVYRADSMTGLFSRVNSDLVTTDTFTDLSPVPQAFYMVRAVKLENTTSGSYSNASQGVFTKYDPTLAIHNAPTVPAGNVGVPMTFTLDVTGGTAGYHYALRSGTLPPGVSLSPTGSLGGAPRAEGTFHFTLQAMDSASASAIREFSLTVGPPLPLQITSSATCPDGTLGFPYHHPLLATGGLAPYNWSVTAGALPDGVALSNDGKLWGRPTAAGTFNFTARVVDSLGVSESKDFTLIVRSSPAVLQFSAAGFSVNENDGTATITVSRSGSSTGAVGVTCFTRNVTASQGADYIATWGTLAWADGDAADKIFTVPIRNNMLKQPNRALEVVLKSPTGSARLGNPFQAPLTIVDDDTPPAPPGAGGNEPPAPPGGSGSDGSPPPEGMPPSDDAILGLMALPTENTPVAELRFSAASYTVSETATNAVITVTRLGNTAYPVGVDFATVGGSAAPDADYTVTAGTLAFDPGETSKTFRVPVLRNAMAEPEETIEVVIANPVGPATLGRPSAAVVRIADPDTRQQPDNLIRVIGERFYVGNNRYNATALGQSRSQSLRLGETRAFEIRVQNDGNVADTFLVRGDGGGDGFGARYFTGVAGGADITADVVSGACLVRDLPPGAFHVIRVELTAGAAARPGSSRSCFVTSVCVADETRQDTVKAVVNLKRR